MRYKVINLKENQPTVELALALLEIEVEVARREGVKVLKIIHGYGSHGVGGEIKRALNYWLIKNKKRGKILDYVKGEHWTSSDKNSKFKQICPEILGDSELYFSNSGVTIILI